MRNKLRRFNWHRLAGNSKLFVLCLLLFSISAFFSFWIAFPADLLQRRLLQEVSQQAGIEMRGSNASMLFPLGMEVDLTIFPKITELNDLELQELQITPVWLSLLSGTPAVNLTGLFAGGGVDVEATNGGLIDMALQNIEVQELQDPDLPYQVKGLLSGEAANVTINGDNKTGGTFSVKLNGAKLLGLDKIGFSAELPLGELRIDGKIGRQRLNLNKIIITGGILELNGGGNILIGKTLAKTRLNLNLNLKPTAATPAGMIDLLNATGIRPTVDGSFLLRISGTLQNPSIR